MANGYFIYLAGKISKNDWRHAIVRNLRDSKGYEDCDFFQSPYLDNLGLGKAYFIGPTFISCDHGGFHGDNSHGVAAGDDYSGGHYDMQHLQPMTGSFVECCQKRGQTKEFTFWVCSGAIDRADIVFAWIESFDCFGTLVELGMAHAKGIPVVIATPYGFNEPDLWFAMETASLRMTGRDAESCFNSLAYTLDIHRDGKTSLWKSLEKRFQEHNKDSDNDSVDAFVGKVRGILTDSESIANEGTASWRNLIHFAVSRPLSEAIHEYDSASCPTPSQSSTASANSNGEGRKKL